MKYYTGVGSRRTPENILDLIEKISTKLDGLGYTLRSGGAKGADIAFEVACTNKIIYLPFKEYRPEDFYHFGVTDEHIEYSMKFHPKPEYPTEFQKHYLGRNLYQVLGHNLKTPSKFLIAWWNPEKPSGTSHTARIAKAHNIPCFNLFDLKTKERLEKFTDER